MSAGTAPCTGCQQQSHGIHKWHRVQSQYLQEVRWLLGAGTLQRGAHWSPAEGGTTPPRSAARAATVMPDSERASQLREAAQSNGPRAASCITASAYLHADGASRGPDTFQEPATRAVATWWLTQSRSAPGHCRSQLPCRLRLCGERYAALRVRECFKRTMPKTVCVRQDPCTRQTPTANLRSNQTSNVMQQTRAMRTLSALVPDPTA